MKLLLDLSSAGLIFVKVTSTFPHFSVSMQSKLVSTFSSEDHSKISEEKVHVHVCTGCTIKKESSDPCYF